MKRKEVFIMLTHVYDKVTETMYYVTTINLIDEEYQQGGTTLYELDLISVDDADIAYFNVPFTITETEEDGGYTYAIADISNYHNEKEIRLYDCEYRDNTLIFSYPDTQELPNSTTVSIYQGSKEPTTKEATTIAELIEILEEIQSIDYTEVVISGAFCKTIKRSK